MKLNKNTLIIIIAAIVVVALAVTLILVLPKNGGENPAGGETPDETPDETPVEPQPELNFFQKIWIAILNFFKKLFGLI